jgi:hypothetical protein
MPLDVQPADKTAALTEGFTDLGRCVNAMLPKTPSAIDRAALEYWASSLVCRLADAWRDRTKRAAVASGALPDHATNPLPVGTAETVYAGPLVTISVKVVEQADRVNVAALVADLEQAGVASRLLKRLVKKHTKSFGGAHVFTASLTG